MMTWLKIAALSAALAAALVTATETRTASQARRYTAAPTLGEPAMAGGCGASAWPYGDEGCATAEARAVRRIDLDRVSVPRGSAMVQAAATGRTAIR